MKHLQNLLILFAVFVLVPSSTLPAGDWPQYRGPKQDGISTESLKLKWGPKGPPLVWTTKTNTGFSSFTVCEGRVFTQVVRDIDGRPREVCLALDADTGKELWVADIGLGKGYSGGGPGDGPRSTPTINDGLVYLFSPDMVVYCVDAATGKPVWKRDLIEQNKGRNIKWRSAASVVIDGDLVFVGGGGPGQSLLALDKKTGRVVWKAHDVRVTHSTPIVATIHGQRQVIFFLQSGLLSVNADNGKKLWHFEFPFNVSTAITPLVCGDIVYCSAGYGVGGAACRITKRAGLFKAQELWYISGNKQVANHWSTPIYKDGHLYGIFCFKKFKTGPLKCVELTTGKVKWEEPGFGQGNVTLAGDRLLALTDYGDLVLVEATPNKYEELSRFKALNGKCWSTPTLSNGRIYVRSTTEGKCFEVK
ncbi:MAG: PQQ-binding-like beta-propeller repeat protein [Pirellulales bacterium]|nr:PQQ-binding-like beta-propeller repeat protein [Pirellulales bacterium]